MYFIKARKGYNEWWRYMAGTILTFLGYLVIGGIPLIIVMTLKVAQGANVDPEMFRETYDITLLGIDRNTGLFLMLFPSVLAFFILWGVMVWLHGKKTGDIASAEGRIRWGRILSGALIWLVLTGLAELVFYKMHPENYTYNFLPGEFYVLVVIVLLFIPFQAWFEELLFRGYLMQGTGLLFGSRLVALLLTASAFGFLHYFNPEVRSFGVWNVMPYYIGFGIFAGLLVIMDNGIELALGVHAINNIYSAVLVTYESSALNTPALFTINRVDPWLLNLVLLISATIFILVMAKIYRWNDWKKIYTRIPGPDFRDWTD
jgi:uncharacterized protein